MYVEKQTGAESLYMLRSSNPGQEDYICCEAARGRKFIYVEKQPGAGSLFVEKQSSAGGLCT
jgi:hypothetical protein